MNIKSHSFTLAEKKSYPNADIAFGNYLRKDYNEMYLSFQESYLWLMNVWEQIEYNGWQIDLITMPDGLKKFHISLKNEWISATWNQKMQIVQFKDKSYDCTSYLCFMYIIFAEFIKFKDVLRDKMLSELDEIIFKEFEPLI
jgi:hypothetical protein